MTSPASVKVRASNRQWWLSVCVAPALASLALLIAASVCPLRLESRNFQDLARLPSPGLRGRPVIYVSSSDGESEYHFTTYVVRRLAWPATSTWITLSGRPGERGVTSTLDSQGRFWKLPAGESVPRESEPPTVTEAVVLFDSEAARTSAFERFDGFRSAATTVVLRPPAPAGWVTRPAANEFSLRRWARIASLLGLPFALCFGFRRWLPWSSLALAACVAIWSAPAVWVWLMSWAQVTRWDAPGAYPYVAWALAAGATWPLRRRAIPSSPVAPVPALLASVAIVGFLSLVVLRLDFDEDVHAHWLLQAHGYFQNGRHVPESVQAHVHTATYPYGFGALLALSGWAADVPRSTFLGLDAASGVALLLYRLGMGALDLAVLYLVAAALGGCYPWRGAAWLLVPALFAAQFPILQGRHVGAETLLLPWLGGTIALLHLARRQARILAFVALAGGAVSTLVKLEALLLFCALALPWVVEALREEPRMGRRGTLLALACVVTGLLPLILWRLDLRVANPVYETPTLAAFRSALPHLGPVFARCAQVLLRDPAALWIFIALPLVWVSSVYATRGSRLAESIVPLSVLGTLGGLPLVYLFSNLPRLAQIDVSFVRLALVPVWSSMFYVISRASRRLPVSAQASA